MTFDPVLNFMKMASFLQLVCRGSVQILSPIAYRQQLVARCLSTSGTSLMKRPVFEGPEYPKKPLSPYILFMTEKKDSVPYTSRNTPDMVALAQKWKELSSSEKMLYQNKYSQLKKEHESTVKEFLDNLGDKDKQKQYMESLTQYRRKRREYIAYYRLKKLGVVKPGSVSAYNVYVSEHRNEFMHGNDPTSLKDGMSSLYEKWRGLSDEEKQSYSKKAQAIVTQRRADYEQRYSDALEQGIIKPPKEKTEKKTSQVKKSMTTKTMATKTSSRKKPSPVKTIKKKAEVE